MAFSFGEPAAALNVAAALSEVAQHHSSVEKDGATVRIVTGEVFGVNGP